MGMTIDEAISHLYTYSSTHGSGITTDEQHEEAKKIAIDTMRKYQTMQEVLEKVWNVPSCMLDEAECLCEIMETYRTVR